MTTNTLAPATRRAPGDRATAPVLGPLALDLSVLGSRVRDLIERIRETGEEVVVLSRGRPIALISAYGTGDTEPDDPVLWDVEAVAP